MLNERKRLEYCFGSAGQCPECEVGGSSRADRRIERDRVCQNPQCGFDWINVYWLTSAHEPGAEEMATAPQLRHGLDQLLLVFDELDASGEDWSEDERVQLARKTLAQGFPADPENDPL